MNRIVEALEIACGGVLFLDGMLFHYGPIGTILMFLGGATCVCSIYQYHWSK